MTTDAHSYDTRPGINSGPHRRRPDAGVCAARHAPQSRGGSGNAGGLLRHPGSGGQADSSRFRSGSIQSPLAQPGHAAGRDRDGPLCDRRRCAFAAPSHCGAHAGSGGIDALVRADARPAPGGGARSVRGQLFIDHGPDQRRGGRRHLPLRARLHARVPRSCSPRCSGPTAAVLRVAVYLHGGDVRAGFCQQFDVAVSLLGDHHALLLSADRLHTDTRGATECIEGARHEPGRRPRLRAGHRLVP